MHVSHKNSSYLSNFRLETGGNLERERQIMVQEQKLCKTRARKPSVETNRRINALAEKQRLWDAQERLQRENILQQRREQNQEATERFQRAHPPPSQRYRRVLRRDAPTIIQGNLSPHAQQSSLSSTTNIIRSSPKIPRPPTTPKFSHHQPLSAVEAYAKPLQEQCGIETLHFRRETDENFERERQILVQEQKLCKTRARKSSVETNHQIKSSPKIPRPPTTPKFSHHQPLSAVEAYAKPLQEQCGIETLQDLQGSHDSDCCISESLSSISESLSSKDSLEVPSNLQRSSCLILLDSKKAHSEQKEQRDLGPAMTLLDENPTLLRKRHKPKQEKQEDSDWAYNGTVVSETLWDLTTMEEIPKTENFPTPHNNDLVAPCKLPKLDQDYYGVKIVQNNHDSNLVTNRVVLGSPDESPYSKPEAPLNLREQRILTKGVLKQSKCVPRDTSCTRGSDYSFATRKALELRDSVELTRAKTKDVQVNRAVRKKLRWFDEVRTGEDHQPSPTKELRSPKPGPNVTPASSTAWADVGVQEQAGGVEVAHSSAKNSGSPRVPQRARFSRAGVGPVLLRTRRGTVIRPQSATEVGQIAKTRGEIMAPRPPPRTEKTQHVVRTPSGLNPACIKYKQALVVEEALPENDSGRIFSPKAQDVITTDSTVVYTTLPHCFLSEGNTKGVPISGHQEFRHNSGRLSVSRGKGLCLDVTPTDEEISQLRQSVCSVLNTKDDETTLKSQALEGRQASQPASSGQGRRPPGSANRRLLQTSQPAKLLRACSRTHYTNLNEGFETTAQLVPEGLLKESQAGGALEVTQTPGPGREQRQEITSISSEEQKILLSLEKLNQKLSYLLHRGAA